MKGWTSHRAAVAALADSYAAVPPGEPVRLAKPTSNLFRPRAGGAAGLDVSGLDGVIALGEDTVSGDPMADVQGMCSYETLVDTLLPHGLMPLVVPQLRTITLGGAVTGLGIESTSFRSGLPHESVLEMDVLTGSGEQVTATPDGEHAELFAAFPNSYGTLGYATRLRIRLEPVPGFVELRHRRFDHPAALTRAIDEIVTTQADDGEPVDGLDGTVFGPREAYLTLARFTDRPSGPPSDYTGQQVYFRSVAERSRDVLTMHAYLWRWDTDWFWCSAAFGAQHPVVRRLWPPRWRRSDVYHRLVGLDARLGLSRRLDWLRGVPGREKVIQDVEVPLAALEDFLAWFHADVGMRPVWLCPLRTRRPWALYPLRPGETYVNVGFWGTVEVPAGTPAGAVNRRVEEAVHRLGGHKSLYSEAFYDAEEFAALYGGESYEEARRRYDPDARLSTLHEKVVGNS